MRLRQISVAVDMNVASDTTARVLRLIWGLPPAPTPADPTLALATGVRPLRVRFAGRGAAAPATPLGADCWAGDALSCRDRASRRFRKASCCSLRIWANRADMVMVGRRKGNAVLCCAVLCCAVLCCVALCCAVLYCTVRCCNERETKSRFRVQIEKTKLPFGRCRCWSSAQAWLSWTTDNHTYVLLVRSETTTSDARTLLAMHRMNTHVEVR